MTTTEQPADAEDTRAAREAERARIRQAHLHPAGERPASTARGLHHTALISSDVERTIAFYQGVLEFPLTELIENRDYPGSSHFFFDIGNGNLLAFFDFPGLDVGPYAEVLGGLHHMAISVDPDSGHEGVGSALVRGALDDVRADGQKIVPRCPFVKGWIDRHPDYADLVTHPD